MAVATAPSIPRSARVLRGARRAGRVTALWLFGLATTVLLIGVWGRAVASDEGTLLESAHAVVDTDVVSDRINQWIVDGIAAGGAAAPPDVALVVEEFRGLPETQRAIDELVEQAVAAALAEPGTEPVIDVGSALRPLAPVISDRLRTAGVDLAPGVVEGAFEEVAVVVLETEEEAGFAGAIAAARSALTRVVIVAGGALLLAGLAAVALAEDRMLMVRGLLVRIAVSAATFAVILRLGAWAVDPSGGRSPVAAGGSVLLASNGAVLVTIATAFGMSAAAGWYGARRRSAAPA